MPCFSNLARGVSALWLYIKVSQHISFYSFFIHKKVRLTETNTLSQKRLLLLPRDKVKIYSIHMTAGTLSIEHPILLG